MKLSQQEKVILKSLPEITDSMLKSEYQHACITWGKSEGYSSMEVLAVANAAWKSRSIEQMIVAIDRGDIKTLQNAVIMILKDNYLV